MADDEFVIGFSDSEWTGIAPLLEEDVAMSSIAQDELGHAAALYGLLGGLTGTDADALAYDREPDDYRHCRLLDHGRGDWAMTIARRYLYDTAERSGSRRWSTARGHRWRSSSARSSARSATTACTRDLVRAAGARGGGEPRAVLAALGHLAPDAGRYSRHSTARRRSSMPGSWPPRWPTSRRAGGRRSGRPSPRPGCRCHRPTARPRPRRGRSRRRLPMAVGRIQRAFVASDPGAIW